MNSNTPYNSGVMKNMVNKVKVYCSRIIPLVFDNTLSYYETLCGFCAKVNELCDAVNSQNLAITEFCHMVELEIEKFKEYVDTQISTINETISDILDKVRDIESAVGDIQTALANKVDKSDVTNVVEADNENPVTSGAVYEAIQESSGTTVREAQANPTNGFVKGILSTDFQDRANPLSIYNGTLIIRPATETQTGYVQIGDNIRVENGVISVPLASPTAKGLVMASNVDSGIAVFNGTMRINLADPLYIDTTRNRVDIKTATNTQLGVVAPKLGGALNIQSAGEIDAKDATTTQRGVITLTDTITSGDTSHVPTAGAVYNAVQGGGGSTIPDATTTTKGKVQIGDNINVSSGVISVPNATQYTKGVVQASDNIEIANGAISVPDATQSKKGVVMLDAAVTQSSGNVPTSGAVYDAIQTASTTVPDATNDTKGKVRPGVGLNIAAATPGIITLETATQNTLGGFKITDTITDGDTTHVPTADAVYDAVQSASGTVPDATTTTKGKVQIGDNINVSSGVISVPDASALTKGVMTVGSGLSANQGLVYLAQASDSAIGGVKIGDGLKNDANDKLTIDSDTTLAINQNGKLTVRTATPDNVGLATIDGTNSNLTMAYGKIDVPTGSRDTKGVVQIGSNINVGNGTISVPTATPGTLGVATIANTGSNLTMGAGGVIDVPKADLDSILTSYGSYGVTRLCNSPGLYEDSMSMAPSNYGLAKYVENEIFSAISYVSRTLNLEDNSNPNSGAECFLVYDSGTTNVVPTNNNIINSGTIPTRAKPEANLTGGNIHIFVKMNLFPYNLNDNQKMQIITLENKRSLSTEQTINTTNINGFIPWGYIFDGETPYLYNTATWSIGDTYTNNINDEYLHIYASGGTSTYGKGFSPTQEFRVKIDY